MAVGWYGYLVIGMLRSQRMLRGLARGPVHRGLGLVTADPTGNAVLLLVDPTLRPVVPRAVSLVAPLPLAALTGNGPLQLSVYGGFAPDTTVALHLAEHPDLVLYPAERLGVPDAEDLRILLDFGTLLAEEDDDRTSR